MIQGDAPGQACHQEGPSEHELVGRERRIGRIQTGIALDLEAADGINHGDETDVAHSRHMHTALGIQLPLIMRCAFRLDRWEGQFTVLLIGAREFLGLEQRRDARATWRGVIGPARINPQLHKQRIRPPARMRPAHLHDGITHACRKRAQRSPRGAAIWEMRPLRP